MYERENLVVPLTPENRTLIQNNPPMHDHHDQLLEGLQEKKSKLHEYEDHFIKQFEQEKISTKELAKKGDLQ